MRLIPSYIEQDSPPGEVIFYNRLQQSTKEWTAIHSLDLAPFNKNRRTEIDFIIIIPEMGILIVEIKSHKDIHFSGDRWMPGSLKASPFKQALNARGAFHRRLKAKLIGGKRIPVVHCCVFPCSDFDLSPNLSIQSFEVIDQRTLNACRTNDEVCQLIKKNFMKALKAEPEIPSLTEPMSENTIAEIIELCYPVQKRRPNKQEEIKRRQKELEQKLRDQQKPILKLAKLNPRVVVKGPAGTGKTLIGLEIARIKAEQGYRVGFVCFNNLIGNLAQKKLTQHNRPNLIGGSLHSLLISMTGLEVPGDVKQDWWDDEFPRLVQEKFTDPDIASFSQFDYLVIDEAQDILAREELFTCMQLLLDGGYKNGNYLLLGDFVNQNLTFNTENLTHNLDLFENDSVIWELDENCRNYQAIGEAAISLSDISDDVWSGFMRTGGSYKFCDYKSYRNDSEQINLIRNIVSTVRNEGFKDSEITILSFRTLSKSVINALVKTGLTMSKASDFDSDYLKYSSLNAYKGMENKVIIICDVVINLNDINLERRRFYIGATRATEKLYVLAKNEMLKHLILG